jgi:hypothetical protein
VTPINTRNPGKLTRGVSVITASDAYDLLLDWNVRVGDWRATVTRRSDGYVLGAHLRLSPGLPLFEADEGGVYVTAPSEHSVEDLDNGRIVLYWVTNAEFAARLVAVDTDGVLV